MLSQTRYFYQPKADADNRKIINVVDRNFSNSMRAFHTFGTKQSIVLRSHVASLFCTQNYWFKPIVLCTNCWEKLRDNFLPP